MIEVERTKKIMQVRTGARPIGKPGQLTPSDRRRRDATLIVGGLILLLGLGTLQATTFKMITDADLADQAEVVVQAVVVAREPAPIASPPSTDYFVQIERVLKGYVAGSTVVVRVAGGIGPDGTGLRVWGSPQFQPGERVLLFLAPRADGTYGILHLMLGAFHEVHLGGRRLAVRDLSEALHAAPEWDLLSQGPIASLDPPRRWDAFTRWLIERESARQPTAGYLDVEGAVALSENGSASVLLREPCTELGLRWFGVDRRRPIRWRVNHGTLDGALSPRDLAMSLEVWELATARRLRLSLDGPTLSKAGLWEHDGLNTILFEDPGEWIVGSFDCRAGGVLAVSGVWFDSGRDQQCRVKRVGQKGSVGDQVFVRISSADIVANDGASCFLRSSPARVTEVLAHEVGHTLGLTHAEEVEALMFGPVHDDGRGATLDAWDQNAIDQLYGPPSR